MDTLTAGAKAKQQELEKERTISVYEYIELTKKVNNQEADLKERVEQLTYMLTILNVEAEEGLMAFLRLLVERENLIKELKEYEALINNPYYIERLKREQRRKEIEESGKIVCSRCEGMGVIDAYAHHDGGVCFQCKGRGYFNRRSR